MRLSEAQRDMLEVLKGKGEFGVFGSITDPTLSALERRRLAIFIPTYGTNGYWVLPKFRHQTKEIMPKNVEEAMLYLAFMAGFNSGYQSARTEPSLELDVQYKHANEGWKIWIAKQREDN